MASFQVNCYSLNSVGPGVEKISGPRRYVALYLTSAIASNNTSPYKIYSYFKEVIPIIQ